MVEERVEDLFNRARAALEVVGDGIDNRNVYEFVMDRVLPVMDNVGPSQFYELANDILHPLAHAFVRTHQQEVAEVVDTPMKGLNQRAGEVSSAASTAQGRVAQRRVTPSPPQRSESNGSIIQRAVESIRSSSFYSFNPTLADYLIRIVRQIEQGDIIPISMLFCPHSHMDLACGGRGCHVHTCPTAEMVKKFAAALPSHRINFGNPLQPIRNIMVLNGRERCITKCEHDGSDKTPTPTPQVTPKPTCRPYAREEGTATAALVNIFAKAVHQLGAHVFIVNHGGWGIYNHFFRYLAYAFFAAVVCKGTHIHTYCTRRLAFGRWATREIQGFRISQYVKAMSDAIGDVYDKAGKSLLESIFDIFTRDQGVPFVHQDFLSIENQQASDQSTRLVQAHPHYRAIRDEVVWEHRFAQLEEYRRVHGNANVPQSPRGLGRWVNNQRSRPGRVSVARRARLNSIGFAWNSRDAVWDQRFAELDKPL